jgi:DNA-binding NarL/FixJ family response regulator
VTGEQAELKEFPAESRTSVAFATRPESTRGGSAKIQVVLVDDHPLMRQGLASLLRAEPDISVIGEASDGEAAIDLVRKTKPAVVLMDISMPGMDGIEATRRIHEQMPEVKIIGLSMFQEDEQGAAIITAGAIKYLPKTGPSDAVIETIRDCMKVADGTIVN